MATTKSVAPVTTSGVDNGKGFVYDQPTDQMVLVPLARTTRVAFSNAAYTASASDRVIAQIGTLSAARVVTLPAASAVPAGTLLQIVDESGSATGTFTLSWARAGADTINGAASNVVAVNSAYGSGWIESDGATKWTTVSTSGGGGSGFVTTTGGGKETVVTATVSGTYAANITNGNLFNLTMSASTAITLSGATSGVLCSVGFVLRQNATGNFVPSFTNTIKWIGVTPSYGLTASKIAGRVTLETVDGGSEWAGYWAGAEQ